MIQNCQKMKLHSIKKVILIFVSSYKILQGLAVTQLIHEIMNCPEKKRIPIVSFLLGMANLAVLSGRFNEQKNEY